MKLNKTNTKTKHTHTYYTVDSLFYASSVYPVFNSIIQPFFIKLQEY